FENGPLTTITFEKRADGSCDFAYTGNYAFANTSLTSITFPKSYTGCSTGTSVASYVFYNCSSLTSITYEEDGVLRGIGTYALAGTGITSITIPYSINTVALGNYAFNNCANLTSVVWQKNPLGKTSKATLGEGVFSGCTALKHIVLAKTVTPNNSAFKGLDADTVVYFDSLGSPTADWLGKKYLENCAVKLVWGWSEDMGFMKADGTFEGNA
ncbi:MAG: leucine-rich repeat domain-containing protein, partial [Clostridiales bacterium]|nr:leucine-rich repeat domain-containing protein [Clostridiales bacterium]